VARRAVDVALAAGAAEKAGDLGGLGRSGARVGRRRRVVLADRVKDLGAEGGGRRAAAAAAAPIPVES